MFPREEYFSDDDVGYLMVNIDDFCLLRAKRDVAEKKLNRLFNVDNVDENGKFKTEKIKKASKDFQELHEKFLKDRLELREYIKSKLKK